MEWVVDESHLDIPVEHIDLTMAAIRFLMYHQQRVDIRGLSILMGYLVASLGQCQDHHFIDVEDKGCGYDWNNMNGPLMMKEVKRICPIHVPS